jgi:outer membrane protein TolC
MELQPLNDNACNHEQVRAALRAANANFETIRQELDRLVGELEEIKRARPM